MNPSRTADKLLAYGPSRSGPVTYLIALLLCASSLGVSLSLCTVSGVLAQPAPKNLSRKMDNIRALVSDGLAQARANYLRYSPADAFLKKLPTQAAVLSGKDKQAFLSYGGLCEVYLFEGNEDKANELLEWVRANSASVLGPDDPYVGMIYNDFGLYYYKKSPELAESMLQKSLPILENADRDKRKARRENLLSVYAALALIDYNKGDFASSQRFVDKLKALTQQQANGDEKQMPN